MKNRIEELAGLISGTYDRITARASALGTEESEQLLSDIAKLVEYGFEMRRLQSGETNTPPRA